MFILVRSFVMFILMLSQHHTSIAFILTLPPLILSPITHTHPTTHLSHHSYSPHQDLPEKKKKKSWWSRFLQLFRKKRRAQNPLSISRDVSQPFDSTYTTKEGLRRMKRPSIPLSYSTISLPTAQRGSVSKRTSLDGVHSDITSYPSGENSSGMTWRACCKRECVQRDRSSSIWHTNNTNNTHTIKQPPLPTCKPTNTLPNGTIGDHSGDTSAGSEESHRSLL